jgi:ribose-phosphate pyrophosphokinase
LCNAADELIAHGGRDVLAYIPHGVLSGGAIDRISKSRLRELVVSDTTAPTQEQKSAANISTLPIARTAKEESVLSLFD